MALNPPLTNNGDPLRVSGEYMILQRKDIECEFKIPQLGKKTGYGILYLTTCRMVFVNKKHQTSDFKSFDIPLYYLSNEGFEQPVFGSNYLRGNVQPLFNLLPGETTFKL